MKDRQHIELESPSL